MIFLINLCVIDDVGCLIWYNEDGCGYFSQIDDEIELTKVKFHICYLEKTLVSRIDLLNRMSCNPVEKDLESLVRTLG